ncbi:hypothetical protein EV426DRAFT_584452 [Tirmania nivea]|nr:hypothetical protein EV426DRAFT_584452 [Tirmania nivea]
MSGNSLPWLVRSTASDISEPYTLDINYEVMERKGAGEGSNFPPVLPRPERARVTQNRSMPEERDTSMFRSQMLTSQVFPNEGGHFRYIDSPFSAGESIFGEKPPGYFPPLLWGTDDFWNPPIRNDDDSDEDDENDDEMYAVTWDWHGNIQAWLHSYTSPQDVFEPHMACRTPLSEDGMAHLVLNDADESPIRDLRVKPIYLTAR